MNKVGHQNNMGFTLIELIVTLAVAAITLTLAVPSFRTFLLNNQQSADASSLIATLQSARSEAIRRAKPITVCASSNQTSCGTEWGDGWIIFVDENTEGSVDTGDKVLRVFSGVTDGHSLKSSLGASVTYSPSGMTETTTGGLFTLCDRRGSDYAHGVLVSATGAVRSSAKTASGDPLTCS